MTRDQRNGRRLTKSVGFVVFMALVCLAMLGKVDLPSTSNVTSNMDDYQWRPLDASVFPTTTTHALTSEPQRTTTTVTATPDEITVIFGSKVIHIHRNPGTQPLFTKLEGMIR